MNVGCCVSVGDEGGVVQASERISEGRSTVLWVSMRERGDVESNVRVSHAFVCRIWTRKQNKKEKTDASPISLGRHVWQSKGMMRQTDS